MAGLFKTAFMVLLGCAALLSPRVSAQGIPEPNLVLYGVITAQTDQGDIRLTTGNLSWQIQISGGAPITVNVALTNINDQFSYVAYVPLETEIPGIGISANALKVTANPATYSRANVTIDGSPAVFVQPSQTTFSLAAVDRGRLERVDLTITGICPDGDMNGLPDCWEEAYFGFSGVNPDGDDDSDGASNRDEFKAGTNPKSAASLFAFLTVERQPGGGGVMVEWSSVEGKTYAIDRSEDLLTGYAPVASNLLDTAPRNSYLDISVSGPVQFYRVRIQE